MGRFLPYDGIEQMFETTNQVLKYKVGFPLDQIISVTVAMKVMAGHEVPAPSLSLQSQRNPVPIISKTI